MKRQFIIIGLLAVSAMTLFGQGRVRFNNLVSFNPIYGGPTGGVIPPPLVYAGADHSIQLLWAPGTYADQAAFNAANPSSSASFAFFGVTGSAPAHGPGADQAGLFDAGIVALGGAAGTYTMQARGWFNGGLYPAYADAVLARANVGRSELFTINATESPAPLSTTLFPSFTIFSIPEPSTFALAGLGAGALVSSA